MCQPAKKRYGVTKKANKSFIQLSYWAVGRVSDTSQVAVKLNDFPAFLMSVEDARHLSIALHQEAHALSQEESPPARGPAATSAGPAKK
jgi:hypothetical protein